MAPLGTTQACLFRDSYAPLTATGFAIYGLSADSPKANTTFKTKHQLPYPLLCDPSVTLIGAIGLKKAPKGTTRGVFVVNKSGKVLAAEPGSPAGTVEVVKKLVGGAPKAADGKAAGQGYQGRRQGEGRSCRRTSPTRRPRLMRRSKGVRRRDIHWSRWLCFLGLFDRTESGIGILCSAVNHKTPTLEHTTREVNGALWHHLRTPTVFIRSLRVSATCPAQHSNQNTTTREATLARVSNLNCSRDGSFRCVRDCRALLTLTDQSVSAAALALFVRRFSVH